MRIERALDEGRGDVEWRQHAQRRDYGRSARATAATRRRHPRPPTGLGRYDRSGGAEAFTRRRCDDAATTQSLVNTTFDALYRSLLPPKKGGMPFIEFNKLHGSGSLTAALY